MSDQEPKCGGDIGRAADEMFDRWAREDREQLRRGYLFVGLKVYGPVGLQWMEALS